MAAMLCIANVGTPWLSISGAFYLLPYFLCGIFFSRFPFELKQKKIIGFLLMTAIILFLLFYGHEYGGGRRSLNALLIGTLSCTALLFIRGESELLARIGFYSYSIHLFHVFFTAASRIVFTKIGITNIRILFVPGTLLGIVGPILVELVATRYTITRILLPGKSKKKFV